MTAQAPTRTEFIIPTAGRGHLLHYLGRHAVNIPKAMQAMGVCRDDLYPCCLHYGPDFQMILDCYIDPDLGLIYARCKVPTPIYKDHFCAPEQPVVPAVLGVMECGNQALGSIMVYPRYHDLCKQLEEGEVVGIRAFRASYDGIMDEIDPNLPVSILLHASQITLEQSGGLTIPAYLGKGVVIQHDATRGKEVRRATFEVTGMAVAYRPEASKEKRILTV